jgi:NAD(P)-dependent dehydrogenase (short-subunit alcohol dehydrogenase family)
MESLDFLDKVVLVTGGSKGIGRASAKLFAQRGATVALIARTDSDLTEAARSIEKETGRRCFSLSGDVSDFAMMQMRFRELSQECGRLDILVNCAGTNNPKGILETTFEEWQEVIDVNLSGVFICCKLGAEYMIRQNEGCIINVSSVQSRVGGRSVQYSASKAGVEGLTRSLAKQLAPYGVRVNAVAPGSTDTDLGRRFWSPETRERLRQQTLVGRIADPREIANVIAFVASRDASYMTGTTVHVNGGSYLD